MPGNRPSPGASLSSTATVAGTGRRGVADSEHRIERQHQLIAGLAQGGDDTILAEREPAALLQGHEQLQASKSAAAGGLPGAL